MEIRLSELASRLEATLEGDGDPMIRGVAAIGDAGPDEITFVANPRYLRHLATTRAAAVLVGPDVQTPEGLTRLVCEDPYYAFRNALIELVGFREHPEPMGAVSRAAADDDRDGDRDGDVDGPAMVSEQAAVHPEATIGAGAAIHPFAVVERGATVGARTVLYPGSYVGLNATVGDDSVLHPNATVYDRCRVGNRVILHAGTVIGQDGFGFATHKGVHHKIPQTGIAVIEDDVELGANNAIERAAMGETRIGAGTKMADCISIGHGTTVGRGCLFVSLVGISGSVDVGDYVVLGGQVGVAGHLKIGDFVQAAGKTGIASDVEKGARIGGSPSVSIEKFRRNSLVGMDLGTLARRVKDLERAGRRGAKKTAESPPPSDSTA